MSVLVCQFQGRFGNQTMQWLFAYAFAQKHNMEFQCNEWIGERIFTLPEYKRPAAGVAYRRVNEIEIFGPCLDLSKPYYDDREFRGYAQSQRCMIYTKRQARDWLTFRREIIDRMGGRDGWNSDPHPFILAHRRVGDYRGYNYPIVSAQSYEDACREFCFDPGRLMFVTEEQPFEHPYFSDWAPFLPDFFRMTRAPVLLRGNSSFSWLAGLLGNGLVLSPVIDGLEGGKEHHCKFVAGNHPKFAPHLDFVEDLYVCP